MIGHTNTYGVWMHTCTQTTERGLSTMVVTTRTGESRLHGSSDELVSM